MLHQSDVTENNKNKSAAMKKCVVFAVLLLCAVNAGWMLSQRELSNHEGFVSVTARTMLEGGDWVWPTFNGEPRLQKTPLSYWLVAGLSKITGKVDEFTARLPSTILAFLSAAAILYFVNHWMSFRIAVISVSVWATSLAYICYSRSARPEMALTFFITLCFLSFYSAVIAANRRQQIAYMLIFWTSFGLANLAKGPAPLPLVLVPLFFYVVINRKWEIIPKLLPITGTLIFLIVVLPWPLFIAHRLNWDLTVWKREFIDRFFGDYVPGHHPVYYYLLVMFRYVAPWVIFLPLALAAPFYRVWNKKQPVMLFLWLWFVAGLIFASISGGKRQHYILPIMPAMAVLIGILLEDMVFVRKAYTLTFAKNVLRINIVFLIVASVGIICVAIKQHQYLWQATVLAVLTLIVAGTIAVLFAKKKNAYSCAAIFGGYCVLTMLAIVMFVAPLPRYTTNLAAKVAATVPQSGVLVAYHRVKSSFIHYFGRAVPVASDLTQARQRYQQGDWIIAFGEHADDLLHDGRFEAAAVWEKAEQEDDNKLIDVAVFHKPDVASGSMKQ